MAGGAVGGLLGFVAHRWRFSADRWSDAADELRKDIVELADRASAFWLTDRSPNPELAIEEVRIRGAIERLNALVLPYQDWCSASDAVAFATEYAAFVDAISGGAFTSKRRKVDAERAFRIQAAAADLVVRIRNSLRTGITFRSAVERRIFRRVSERVRRDRKS
jgi:hypothetical protein